SRAGAAGARLAGPAVGRNARQSAVRLPSRVPCPSQRGLHRTSEEVELAYSRPRPPGTLVRGAVRAAGRAPPARGLREGEGASRPAGPGGLSLPVPAGHAAPDLRGLRRGVAARDGT